MGGFKLYGPDYEIQNIKVPGAPACRCPGYSGHITKELETFFINQPVKKITGVDLEKLLNTTSLHVDYINEYTVTARSGQVADYRL